MDKEEKLMVRYCFTRLEEAGKFPTWEEVKAYLISIGYRYRWKESNGYRVKVLYRNEELKRKYNKIRRKLEKLLTRKEVVKNSINIALDFGDWEFALKLLDSHKELFSKKSEELFRKRIKELKKTASENLQFDLKLKL